MNLSDLRTAVTNYHCWARRSREHWAAGLSRAGTNHLRETLQALRI